MKIIGHRGAAGLALENSLESIKEGVKAGADFAEIDVRRTRDHRLVLCHDENLKRTYGVDLKIIDHSLKDILAECPNLPTLEQALHAIHCEGVIIELKDVVDPRVLFAITNKYSKLDIRFASFHHSAIREIKQASPESFCYVLEHHSPFEIINHASKMKASGIGLNYGVINPLTYLLARRKKLHIYIYTLNRTWIARFFKLIYRDIYICTDNPKLLKGLVK